MEGAMEPTCPICYELLKGKAFYGCFSCANAFHVECLNKSVVAGNAPVCPVCRSDWHEDQRTRTRVPFTPERSGNDDSVRVFLEEERSFVAPREINARRELGEGVYDLLRIISCSLAVIAFLVHEASYSKDPPGFPVRPCALEKARLCYPDNIRAEYHGFDGFFNFVSSITCICLNVLGDHALKRVASCSFRVPYIALVTLHVTYALSAVGGVSPFRHVVSVMCFCVYIIVHLTCLTGNIKIERKEIVTMGCLIAGMAVAMSVLGADAGMLAAGACALAGTALEYLNQKRSAAYGRCTHVALFLLYVCTSCAAHIAVAVKHTRYPVPVPHIEGVLNSTILY